MSANTRPIFPLNPKISWGTVLTADSTVSKNHDGTSSGAVCIFTAGTNGSRIDTIKAIPLGTNVSTALRIFINNGSDQTVSTNNSIYKDITAISTTTSEVAGQSEIVILQPSDNRPIILPSGYKIYAVVGTTIASGLQVTVQGGDY